LGLGVWAPTPNPQSPIPNPQSPNEYNNLKKYIIFKYNFKIKIIENNNEINNEINNNYFFDK